MSAIKNMIRDNYNMMLLRDYLRREIKEAGFSHFDIQKQPTGTRVSLYVVRPGVVIGRKGAVIRALTEQLETDFDYKNPQIRVEEIARPELSPSVMCNRMASHIERGTAFRRATMWTLRQVMEAGAMGVQITVSGKLRGDRSSFEKHTSGILPRAGHHAQVIVDEDIAHVQTPMGLIGIRIRIAHKEKYKPEFSLTGQAPSSTRPATRSVAPPPAKEEEAESASGTKTEAESASGTKTEAESASGTKTESEHILEEEAKMKTVITLEQEESQLK